MRKTVLASSACGTSRVNDKDGLLYFTYITTSIVTTKKNKKSPTLGNERYAGVQLVTYLILDGLDGLVAFGHRPGGNS